MESPGQRLMQELNAEYDFDAQEKVLVELIASQLDRIAELDAIVERDGLAVPSAQGVRVHPAATESRQLALSVARLVATLRLPLSTDEDGLERLPQRRGALRGVYAGGGA